MSIKADEALGIALRLPGVSVLDVGCGEKLHAAAFEDAGYSVDTISISGTSDYVGFYEFTDLRQYDIIWCSHCLEHSTVPGIFLTKVFNDLNDGGWFCVTVPPAKPEIVGGHVTLWNEGLLIYNLVLAGFDCSNIKLKKYGYNISAIVQKTESTNLHTLTMDYGDIEKISKYFPFDIKHGDVIEGPINW